MKFPQLRWDVKSKQEVSYSLFMTKDILNHDNPLIASYAEATGRALVVVDGVVMKLYGEAIREYFEAHSISSTYVILDGGEENKNNTALHFLFEHFEKFSPNRRSEPIIAIGGGVVLDVVGMACSIYRRGIPYVRIPTTLLSIVDVSIAAKTAINHFNRRNRLGSYFAPVASLLSAEWIESQDTREVVSGMGEILKMAVIKDEELFKMLELEGHTLVESRFSGGLATTVIAKAIDGMKAELEDNLWETNLKRCVDFGHTFSPLIEMRSLLGAAPLLHGEAVAMDVIFSSVLAVHRELLTLHEMNSILSVATQIGLPVSHPLFLDVKNIMEALYDTTKHRNGNQHIPVPKGIGNYTFIEDLKFEEVCDVMEKYKSVV